VDHHVHRVRGERAFHVVAHPEVPVHNLQVAR
jgi:hypothetical protein